MLHNLSQLRRYRGLIQSLVARELKARYRGSVLGFFWSFFNPLLLLLVYSFVFKYVLPARFPVVEEHYELFLFVIFAGYALSGPARRLVVGRAGPAPVGELGTKEPS